MGITGLLPQLKSVTENVNVSVYHSLTVGIDASCWLHRSVYGCATQLAMGQPTEAFVRFCENWLQMLLSNGVIPFFVFDGANLPAKQGTEASRKQSRDTAMEEGRAAYARGDLGAAHTAFTRAVDVTPTMAWQFIRVLRQRGIAYVVAPYEADAQLAYLCRQGIIQAIITEDSDLLPFGAKRCLFKMDKTGAGQEIQRRNLPACEELSFAHWNDEMWVYQERAVRPKSAARILNMCIMAGCDYLPSLPGFGVRKAHDFVRKSKSTSRTLQLIKFEFGPVMPVDYLQAFSRARLTFLHQRVWCPRTRRMTTVTPFPAGFIAGFSSSSGGGAPPNFNLSGGGAPPASSSLSASGSMHPNFNLGSPHPLDFLGPELTDEMGAAIADGIIDPISKCVFGEALADLSGLTRAPSMTQQQQQQQLQQQQFLRDPPKAQTQQSMAMLGPFRCDNESSETADLESHAAPQTHSTAAPAPRLSLDSRTAATAVGLGVRSTSSSSSSSAAGLSDARTDGCGALSGGDAAAGLLHGGAAADQLNTNSGSSSTGRGSAIVRRAVSLGGLGMGQRHSLLLPSLSSSSNTAGASTYDAYQPAAAAAALSGVGGTSAAPTSTSIDGQPPAASSTSLSSRVNNTIAASVAAATASRARRLSAAAAVAAQSRLSPSVPISEHSTASRNSFVPFSAQSTTSPLESSLLRASNAQFAASSRDSEHAKRQRLSPSSDTVGDSSSSSSSSGGSSSSRHSQYHNRDVSGKSGIGLRVSLGGRTAAPPSSRLNLERSSYFPAVSSAQSLSSALAPGVSMTHSASSAQSPHVATTQASNNTSNTSSSSITSSSSNSSSWFEAQHHLHQLLFAERSSDNAHITESTSLSSSATNSADNNNSNNSSSSSSGGFNRFSHLAATHHINSMASESISGSLIPEAFIQQQVELSGIQVTAALVTEQQQHQRYPAVQLLRADESSEVQLRRAESSEEDVFSTTPHGAQVLTLGTRRTDIYADGDDEEEEESVSFNEMPSSSESSSNFNLGSRKASSLPESDAVAAAAHMLPSATSTTANALASYALTSVRRASGSSRRHSIGSTAAAQKHFMGDLDLTALRDRPLVEVVQAGNRAAGSERKKGSFSVLKMSSSSSSSSSAAGGRAAVTSKFNKHSPALGRTGRLVHAAPGGTTQSSSSSSASSSSANSSVRPSPNAQLVSMLVSRGSSSYSAPVRYSNNNTNSGNHHPGLGGASSVSPSVMFVSPAVSASLKSLRRGGAATLGHFQHEALGLLQGADDSTSTSFPGPRDDQLQLGSGQRSSSSAGMLPDVQETSTWNVHGGSSDEPEPWQTAEYHQQLSDYQQEPCQTSTLYAPHSDQQPSFQQLHWSRRESAPLSESRPAVCNTQFITGNSNGDTSNAEQLSTLSVHGMGGGAGAVLSSTFIRNAGTVGDDDDAGSAAKHPASNSSNSTVRSSSDGTRAGPAAAAATTAAGSAAAAPASEYAEHQYRGTNGHTTVNAGLGGGSSNCGTVLTSGGWLKMVQFDYEGEGSQT